LISSDAGISILSNGGVIVRVTGSGMEEKNLIIKITFHKGDGDRDFVVLANQTHNNVLILVE
jgi:hypothetical protein